MDHPDFLAAILANPDDDSLRLIFADWLEERGDPRGEFIRVQIELARQEAAEPFGYPFVLGRLDRQRRQPPSGPLVLREQLLLSEHGREWRAGLTPWARRHSLFHRGFPSVFDGKAAGWLRGAKRLCQLTPVEELWLSDLGNHWTRLARNPCNAQLVGLGLIRRIGEMAPEPSESDFAALAAGHFPRLRRLRLFAGTLTPALLGALGRADWPSLAVFWPSGGLDGAGMEALARGRILGTVEDLSVMHSQLGQRGAEALAASSTLGRLRILEAGNAALGDQGLAALANCPRLANLRSLQLWSNEVGDAGALALAASPHLQQLERIELSRNRIGDAGAEALAMSPNLTHVTHLELADNQFGDAGALAFVRSPYLAGVVRFCPAHNRISPAIKQALRDRFGSAVFV
jgi:uncharacterized protein (TIGR02996 family)